MADERDAGRSQTDESEREVLDRCAACGTQLPAESWHPTLGCTDDESYRLVRFCSDRCRDDWRESHCIVDSC